MRKTSETHEGLVDVGHEQFDELLLNVERLDETREPGREDVSELILVEQPNETGVGALRETSESAKPVEVLHGLVQFTSGSK